MCVSDCPHIKSTKLYFAGFRFIRFVCVFAKYLACFITEVQQSTLSWAIFFLDYGGFCISRSVCIVTGNLGTIAHFVAEIHLCFIPETTKVEIEERNFCMHEHFSYIRSLHIVCTLPHASMAL